MVDRKRTPAADHQCHRNGQSPQVKFNTIALLLFRPVHKQLVWRVHDQDRHYQVVGLRVADLHQIRDLIYAVAACDVAPFFRYTSLLLWAGQPKKACPADSV